jgi:ABC-type uncharacterized transport system permease subunit
MKEISQFLSYLLPILYLGVLYVYFTIFTGKKKNWTERTTWLLVILVVLHGLEIALRNIAIKTIPLSTTHDALSFLAFSIIVVYMILELSLKNRGSGLIILFFAFVLALISTFNLTWEPETNELLAKPTFAIHASFAMAGYTAISLSTLYSIMYIIQNYNIKKRRLGKLFDQLPALTYLEKMSIRAAFIGIVLLGIGLVSGHVQAYHVLGEYIPKDIKVIVSDFIWILYLVGYLMAKMYKWHGRKMAYWSITGFFLLIVGGFTVVYLSESFHEFY